MSQPDVVLARLEDQLSYYEQKSSENQRKFKRLKTATIVISVSIPLSAAFLTAYPVITGTLGSLVALFEALQQLNQYHQNWITYRGTAEALTSEKHLFLSGAGPYASATNPLALLAERVEALVAQEHAKWTAAREQARKVKETSAAR